MKFAIINKPREARRSGPSGQNNIVFVKEDDFVEEDNTVAACKRSANRETLTKQQGMQNGMDDCNKALLKQKVSVRLNPYFPITRKAPKKCKMSGKSLRVRW